MRILSPSTYLSNGCLRGQRRGELRFPGALLMLLPLVSLGLAIAWLQHRPLELAGYPDAPAKLVEHALPTWTGRLEQSGGAWLGVRLTRLHLQAGLQDFESHILSRRFERERGEAWQLEMVASAGWNSEVDLSGLRVQGAGQGLLEPLVAYSQPDPTELIDPVDLLFSGPLNLRPDQTRRCVLWGVAPEGQARLLAAGLDVPLVQENLLHLEGPLVLRSARAEISSADESGASTVK